MPYSSTLEIETPLFQGLPLEVLLVVVGIKSKSLFKAPKF